MTKLLQWYGVMMLLAGAAAMSLALQSVQAASNNAASGSDTSADKSLAVDDPAPAWKDLIGVDDQSHSLGDLADAKAVVVVFTCNHCPVAQAYEDRIIQLAADYQEQGVELVAINVNNLEADKLPAMKQRAEEKGFKFAYLYDSSQQIGHSYGATVTPHAYLLDQGRRVAYIGAIDDNMASDKVTQHYLRDAIDAVLAGSKPAVASTKAFGCGIKYE